MRYDADRKPDAAAWLDLDEDDRISKIVAYHRWKRIKLENERVHAIAHLAVENQVALGEPLVSATLARLMKEGLTRHDAIHAVGTALMGVIYDVGKNPKDKSDPNAQYQRELAALTAASWRAQAEPDS